MKRQAIFPVTTHLSHLLILLGQLCLATLNTYHTEAESEFKVNLMYTSTVVYSSSAVPQKSSTSWFCKQLFCTFHLPDESYRDLHSGYYWYFSSPHISFGGVNTLVPDCLHLYVSETFVFVMFHYRERLVM